MQLLSNILIAIVALEHFYILYLEMFAWTTKGPKAFPFVDKDLFPKTIALAANQGLYNGFLAAGLVWSLLIADEVWSSNIAYFFLGCVIVAATYGAATADKKILLKQGLPAIIAMVVKILSNYF